MRLVMIASLLLATPSLLGGCYYWQATLGHLELMRQRRPVAEVMEDPATNDAVRAKLGTATAALDFAHAELALPDNGSYRLYADTGRRYVVWNVVAAPEFSLEPRTWCFPVAGCVSYRGYFDEAKAQRFADGLAAEGDDVFVGGVAAYSTLGKFEDPILNTMVGYADYLLAGLIFHELAHQRAYVKDDSTFNEGFASFVEQEGLRRWLNSIDAQDLLCRYRLFLRRREATQALLDEHRVRLEALYASNLRDAERREGKAAIIAELVGAYRDLRARWAGPPHFDHWFDGALNNARLASFATYDEYVPAFASLLTETGGDLEAFYARVEDLAALGPAERTERMRALLARGGAADAAAPECPVPP